MMDETNKAVQDGEQQEGAASTSEGQEGTTSKEKTKTYTTAEINKIRSDAAAAAGREAAKYKAEVESLREQQKTLSEQLAELQAKTEEAELETVRNDPDKLKIFQTNKTLRKQQAELAEREARLAREKAEHEANIKAYQDWKLNQTAEDLAKQYGVPKDVIIKLSSTPEQMTAIAETLAANMKQPVTPPKGDSGVTIGGANARYTRQQLDDMSMAQYSKLTDEQKRPID